MTTVAELLGNPESVGFWDLVPERSRITFRNKTMWGALKVHGVFTEFSGDGQITDTIEECQAVPCAPTYRPDSGLHGRTPLRLEQLHPVVHGIFADSGPCGRTPLANSVLRI